MDGPKNGLLLLPGYSFIKYDIVIERNKIAMLWSIYFSSKKHSALLNLWCCGQKQSFGISLSFHIYKLYDLRQVFKPL